VEFALTEQDSVTEDMTEDSGKARLSIGELAPDVRAILAPWHDRGVLRLDARIVFGPFV